MPSRQRGPSLHIATLRVFSADDSDGDYPRLDEIYLDEECRRQLGIESESLDYLDTLVFVRPSRSRAIQANVLIIGLAFLLGLSTFSTLVAQLWTGLSPWQNAVVSLVVASAPTVLLAWINVRARARR